MEKVFSLLWEAINPQKSLDKLDDRLTKAKISQKKREQLFDRVTTAIIIYGLWELAIITLIIIFTGIYFIKP